MVKGKSCGNGNYALGLFYGNIPTWCCYLKKPQGGAYYGQYWVSNRYEMERRC
jgi:hypothetical protein